MLLIFVVALTSRTWAPWDSPDNHQRQRLQRARGAFNNDIRTLIGQGQLARAEEHARAELRGNRESLGKRHPNTLNSMSSLAVVLWQSGSAKESEALQREALRLMEEVLGATHADTRTCRDNLIIALRQRGGDEEAAGLAATNACR